MSRFALSLFVGWLSSSTVTFADNPAPPAKDIRSAVSRALPLIQKGAAGHLTHRTCFACHNQGIPILAMTTARTRGFTIDDRGLQDHLKHINSFLDSNRDNYRKGKGQGGAVDMAGGALWTLALGGWKPNETTAAVVEYILQSNKEEGHWKVRANRPPSEASSFSTTYVAIRSLEAFGTKEQQKQIEKRLQEAADWLTRTKSKDNEDRVFRLWALKRAGASARAIQTAAKDLIASQRSDGGWAQLENLESDAYATGTALVALHESGSLASGDPVYQRGIQFLLRSQKEDGSWHVRSRSRPFQTYFESGFPHGKDQFISLAGSSWATTALILALPIEK